MNIDIVRIAPQRSNAVYVQWDFTPNTGVVGNFSFVLERSGNPEGPWKKVTTTSLINTVNYTDSFSALDNTTDEINLLSVQRSIYYRVTVTDPNNQSVTSPPVDIDGEVATDPAQQNAVPNTSSTSQRIIYLRRKILRDETVALTRLNGVVLYILKRKHFGQRCTNCFDKLTKAVKMSKCPVCFGTSWTGGYFAPIQTYGRLTPPSIQNSLANDGKNEINTIGLTLLNYPKVEELDIIVEKSTNRRWLVKGLMPTSLKKIVVHQRITVVELPRTSAEYQIGVNL